MNTTALSANGDSGSPVLVLKGGVVYVVGMRVAMQTYPTGWPNKHIPINHMVYSKTASHLLEFLTKHNKLTQDNTDYAP